MKIEALQVSNLSLKISHSLMLDNISFLLGQGECTSFLGLSNSGKDELVDILNGELCYDSGRIYIDDVFMPSSQKIKAKVHHISPINYAIHDWTAAEYIGLVTKKIDFPGYHLKRLEEEISRLLICLDIPLDARKKIAEMSEIEKRLMDLAKSCYRNASVLVIEDEFDGCTSEDIINFGKIMKRITDQRMTVILNSYSDLLNQILTDFYIIFEKGRMVKRCSKEQVQSPKELKAYIAGNVKPRMYITEQENAAKTINPDAEIFSIRNYTFDDGQKIDFSFAEKEIVSIHILDRQEKKRLFNIMSGRIIDRKIEFFINHQKKRFKNVSDFVNHNIVSIAHIGTQNELLPKVSAGDNIVIPSLKKFSFLNHILYGKKLTRMLDRQIKEKIVRITGCECNGILQNIAVQFERWDIYHPKVIIILEPFLHCDAYESLLIKSYIRNFASNGCAVILLQSRIEQTETLSDRIIEIQ